MNLTELQLFLSCILIFSILECKQNDKVFDLKMKHYEINYICCFYCCWYLQSKRNLIPLFSLWRALSES